MNEFELPDIPEQLQSSVNELLWNYTVGILRLEKTPKGLDPVLSGSGTLVNINGIYAILTAYHVIKCLPKEGRLGLILSKNLEQTTIDIKGLHYLKIGEGPDLSSGPDIAAIILSPSIAATLKAKKSFCNLIKQSDKLLNNPPEINAGPWIVQGFVDEFTKIENNNNGYEKEKAFCNFSTFGGVKDYRVIDDYDYVTFLLNPENHSSVPEYFNGVSGGGLWQLMLKEDSEKNLIQDEVLLRGVVFYQVNSSALNCHCSRSIYDIAISNIEGSRHGG